MERAFSGSRYWDDSPQHGKPHCAVDNQKVVQEKAMTQAINGELCRQACEGSRECTGFSFNTNTLACKLLGRDSGVGTELGTYYSEAACRVSPEQLCSSELMLVGLTLSIHTVETTEECAVYCSEARPCQYYMVHLDTKACVLMKEVSGAEYSTGFLSGHDGCTTLS